MADNEVPAEEYLRVSRPKARPLSRAHYYVTCFGNVAEDTQKRCHELGRMTSPDIMRASARAKAECKRKGMTQERDADVPHDSIIGEDDTVTQWLNRYSVASLRWPMFDMTSLLSWVWGLPMVVPTEEFGSALHVESASFVC